MNTLKRNILWDLGNTLVKVDDFSFARHLGLVDLAIYSLRNQTSPKKLVSRALDFLDTITCKQHAACSTTFAGRTLPPIVCDWLTGKISSSAALSTSEKPFPLAIPAHFFSSTQEERLVKNLLKTIANPEIFAHCVRIIDDALCLLKECAQQVDQQGNPAHNLFIFSNWDKKSYEQLIKSTYTQELFSYFKPSHQIISGRIGYVKPEDEAFSYVIHTYNLVPSECILIDDQEENIRAAQRNGLQGILLEHSNFQKVRSQLQNYRVLPKQYAVVMVLTSSKLKICILKKVI